MLTRVLMTSALALAIGATAPAPGFSQEPQSLPSKQQTPPDAGAQPDAQVPGPNVLRKEDRNTNPDAQTMAQPVPGAMPDSQTVPSTISEKNAEADKLPTVAYALRSLTDEQREAIWQALKGQPAGAAFNADIGVLLPTAVRLQPVPSAVAQRAPQAAGYRYAVTNDRVLLVSPIDPVVVGVITK